MTEPEDFLSRWSRRKRQTKADEQPKRDESVATKATDSDAPAREPRELPPQSDGSKPEELFDLSKLPSLDSIGPATDIRMFMQPGVPEALSRAALRRAWSADPGIRDFIGLSENSWDFTAEDGMHGFGALDPADAKRMLAELFRERDDKTDIAADDAVAEAGQPDADDGPEQAAGDALEATSGDPTGTAADAAEPQAADDSTLLQSSNCNPDFIATQQKQPEPAPSAGPVRRTHGRALPE